MLTKHRVKAVAGICSVLTLACLFVVYGKVVANIFFLPVPDLSLKWGGFSLKEVSFASYQENPTLIIPKLNLQAPIVEDVSASNTQEYDAALKTGVAMARGSADLEANQGNSFIFGHSSNISLKPTEFDDIFAQLPNLVEGDILQVSVAGRITTYKVGISKVINADEVSYFAGGEEKNITLVTCWPLGTTLRRWVVQAVRVD